MAGPTTATTLPFHNQVRTLTGIVFKSTDQYAGMHAPFLGISSSNVQLVGVLRTMITRTIAVYKILESTQ